jgi:TetR/AcrR family transcriptional regulator, acrAB operon repressor
MYLYRVKRSKEDAEQTRQAILAAALGVFNEKGYERATLDDIAKRAGATRGAVYHHFDNKVDVYKTLLLESGRKSVDLIPQAIAEGGTFLEVMQRIFVRQLRAIDGDPALRAEALFALRGDYASIDDVRVAVEERHAAAMATLIQAFAEAQAGGVVRDDLAPRDIARAFFAMQNGLLFLSSLPTSHDAIESSADALARVFIAGIGRHAP